MWKVYKEVVNEEKGTKYWRLIGEYDRVEDAVSTVNEEIILYNCVFKDEEQKPKFKIESSF